MRRAHARSHWARAVSIPVALPDCRCAPAAPDRTVGAGVLAVRPSLGGNLGRGSSLKDKRCWSALNSPWRLSLKTAGRRALLFQVPAGAPVVRWAVASGLRCLLLADGRRQRREPRVGRCRRKAAAYAQRLGCCPCAGLRGIRHRAEARASGLMVVDIVPWAWSPLPSSRCMGSRCGCRPHHPRSMAGLGTEAG